MAEETGTGEPGACSPFRLRISFTKGGKLLLSSNLMVSNESETMSPKVETHLVEYLEISKLCLMNY